MALKVDLPQPLTAAWLTKRVSDAPPTLTRALQTVTKAHTGLDWSAFDLPAAVKPDALDDGRQRLKGVQKVIAQGVAQAADAATAAAAEADKALVALKKDKSAARAALTALEEAATAARAYATELKRKAEAAAEAFAGQLAAAEEQAARAAKAASADKGGAGAESADQTNALKLLRASTVPLLRSLPNRKPDQPPPAFMAAIGPQSGALMLKKSVGGAEKGILQTVLNGQGGLKFFRGVAVWEAKAVTLVSPGAVSGAAKKLQAALVKLVKLRLKVRVRKPDGEAEEAEGDADPSAIAADLAMAGAGAGEAGPAAADSGEEALNTPPMAPPEPPSAGAAAKAADQARVATLNAQLMSLIGAIGKRLSGDAAAKDAAKALVTLEGQRKKAAALPAAQAVAVMQALMDKAKSLGGQLGAQPAPLPGAVGAGAQGASGPGDPVVQLDPVVIGGTPGPKAAPDPGVAPTGDAAFDNQRKAVKTLQDRLEASANSFHIEGELKTVRDRLAAADKAATAKDFDTGRSLLGEAKMAADAADGFLKQFDAFSTKRDDFSTLVSALKLTAPDWNDKDSRKLIADSAARVAPPKREYAQASASMDTGITNFSQHFRKMCLDDLKPEVEALKNHADAATIAADVTKLQALLAQQQTDLDARAWRKARVRAELIHNTALRLKQQLDRGGAFKAERKDAADRLAQLIKLPPLRGLQVELAKDLKAADAMGSVAEGRWEDGIDALKALKERMRAARELSFESETWTRERQEAENELARLRSHPAASHMTAEAQAIAAQIDAARHLVSDGGAAGTMVPVLGLAGQQDFAQARRMLLNAWADVQTAVAAADALKGTVQAMAGVSAGSDAPQLGKALAALRDQLQLARNAPHADLCVPEWTGAEKSLEEADKAIKSGTLPAAHKALQQGASNIEAGRRRQVEHARALTMLEVVTRRRDSLAKGTHGKALKPRLAEIQQAEDGCMQALTNGDYPTAMAQLRLGQDRAKAAELDDAVLKGLDERREEIVKKIAEPSLKAVKTEVEKTLKAADKAAQALKTGEASLLLKRAAGQIGAAQVKALAKAGKAAAGDVEKQAREMIDSAGPKAVDDLIQDMDAKVAPEVLAALAKARFGCEMAVGAGSEAPQDSIKRMCALMAQVPDDVVGNPSLKKIEHRKERAPFYVQDQKSVVMNARPKKDKKPDFDKKAGKGRLPERDKDCEPANDKPEDLFDFNMLHELAHSIDDAKGFMAQRMSGSEFGGWIDHGNDIDGIAKVVAKKFKFEGDPRQHAFIVDVILGNSPVFPDAPSGQEEAWANAMTDILGWAQQASREGVWDNQAASAAITMDDGRIYHQAYPSTWVSYEAKARARGITSYQFRAPGEWFSELYAAYKVGKLKPSHPAVKWLSTLKV